MGATPSSGLKSKFSATQSAGSATHTCPLKCNLKLLDVSEPKGGTTEKKLSRCVEVKPRNTLNRRASPTQIPSGARFQITANSKLTKEPRELNFSAVTEATCPGNKHPLLSWTDSTSQEKKVARKGEGKYYRQDLACDKLPGFFSILNSAFALGSKRIYPVEVDSCGHPQNAKGIPAPQLIALVEVFPGDQFEAELELPAYKKKEGPERKSANWTTDRDKQKEEIDAEGKEAGEGYRSSSASAHAGWGSEDEYKKYHEDRKKEELGYKDREPEGMKVKLTQKDGNRTMEAVPDEVIKLYNFARRTEAGIKAIQEWIEDIQIGPGASFKVDIEILVAKLKAEWGYQEFMDDRVFMAVTGSLTIEVIKGSLEAFFGFRSAGLADVLAFLKGEGSLEVKGAIQRDNPDEPLKPDLSVGGQFKISGGVQGQAMWVVKAEGKVQTGFSVELQHIKIFQESAMLKGELEIKLAAMQLILTASCMGFGSKAKTYELTKDRKWPIPIGE